MPSPPQMISIEKAADILDVSVSTVRRCIKSGQLPAYKIGGQIRIKMSDLMAFVDNTMVSSENKNGHT